MGPRLVLKFLVNERKPMTDRRSLRHVLEQSSSIAVVGLSHNKHRASYTTARFMQDHGYRIIPVNPNYTELLGEKCYPNLRSIPEPVDIVNCFRRAEDIPPIADDAIAIAAKVLWMQLGIVNEAAAARAENAGLQVIMNRCISIEYNRLLRGGQRIGD